MSKKCVDDDIFNHYFPVFDKRNIRKRLGGSYGHICIIPLESYQITRRGGVAQGGDHAPAWSCECSDESQHYCEREQRKPMKEAVSEGFHQPR